MDGAKLETAISPLHAPLISVSCSAILAILIIPAAWTTRAQASNPVHTWRVVVSSTSESRDRAAKTSSIADKDNLFRFLGDLSREY